MYATAGTAVRIPSPGLPKPVLFLAPAALPPVDRINSAARLPSFLPHLLEAYELRWVLTEPAEPGDQVTRDLEAVLGLDPLDVLELHDLSGVGAGGRVERLLSSAGIGRGVAWVDTSITLDDIAAARRRSGPERYIDLTKIWGRCGERHLRALLAWAFLHYGTGGGVPLRLLAPSAPDQQEPVAA